MKKFISIKKIIIVVLVLVLIVSSVIIFPIRRNDEPAGAHIGSQGAPIAERIFGTAGAAWDPVHDLTPLTISEALSGQDPRDGYILAPTIFSLAGVDTISTFVLRTPAGYEAASPSISIDGQPQPNVTREDRNTFVVTPAIPLTSNSVFVFRLARDGGDDVTWAFQTVVKYEITSTLPRNQSSNVPVRTGIEISFSYGDELDISDHFRIYPHVEGRFIHRGSTVIFMPTSPLEHGSVYTVTISAGISLPGTSEIITTDHVFSFETAPDPDTSTSQDWSTRVYFSNQHVQFPSFATPYVNFWFNYNRSGSRPLINMELYRIDDRERAIAAVDRLAGAPWWSHINHIDRVVDVSGLTMVSSTSVGESNEDYRSWGGESFMLPNNLSPGFYLLNAVTGDSVDQMVIQITDLAVQVIADNDKALVWVNDMTTGRPPAGVRVRDSVTGTIYQASDYGIAVADRMLSEGEHLVITAGDGKENVVFIHQSGFQSFYGGWWDSGDVMYSSYIGWDDWGRRPWVSPQNANDHYWSALQLDRTLFQRSDTVSLWGFVQNRRQDENVAHVTAVLTEHSWWYSEERDTLLRRNIPVYNGAYSGEIRLPNLDPGSYELAIYHGDVVLNSIFFSVMDYVKPPYQLNVSSSKSAIFAGEEVTFTARTEFFEGTPVPELDISYNFWGWHLRVPNGGQSKTNLDGIVQMSATPTAEQSTERDRVQGERSLNFMAEATLPEIGWTYRESNVRVFVNDIIVRPKATRTGTDATLSLDVHSITLDRINDGTSEHWGDFLDEPIAGQRINVEIVEIYWEAVRDGEIYDHITRQVIPKYRYVERTNSLERFELTTDSEGAAERDFRVPNRENSSYQARLTTTDGNGRTIRHDVYIGRDYSSFYNSANDEFPFLFGANPDGYDIGDDVELTIMRGTEPVTQGNFLFVVVQDGVTSYHIGKNSLSFVFGSQHVPNLQVFAYHFNGHTYTTGGRMSQRLRYNPENLNLIINISTNQDAYRPGDMSTFTITTTDLDGNPKAANVNISLVDEALFALMDYSVDTLAMLYGNVSDSLKFSLATHRTFVSDGIDDLRTEYNGNDAAGAGTMASAAPQASMDMMVAEEAESGGGGSDTRIRERFEDTAVFRSLRTNARGEASFTFELPDNITSWRVTASAISEDLYAGNTIQTVRVTQPMFLHYTLGSTFLVGDAPHIGVNVYGTGLSGGEQVTFEVWREDAPTDIRRATGVSFERVNIPLWEMQSEGGAAIVVRASMSNGFNDAVRHSYRVLNSHRRVDTAVFYEVTPDTVFDVNSGGLTDITFTDKGRGQFLGDLLSLRHIWRSGARVEGLVAKREATRLIRTHFPDVTLYGEDGSFNLLDYQMESGGMAILPYADADLQTTVMLIPFIKDEVNLVTLRGYLRNAYNGSSADNKALALYGLAMLGEPVLLDLQAYAGLTDLSVRNAAYIALGLAALGEMQPARSLYDSRIAPHIQSAAPYYRVNAGTTRAAILDATSVVALLAAQLGAPESLGLHDYAVNYRFDAPRRFNDDALLMNIERLAFISYDISNYTGSAAGITYTLFGETVTRDLGHGGQFNLRIPAQNMHEFDLVSVTGEVGAVSVVRVPLEDMDSDGSGVSIRREYFKGSTNTRATTFEQDELVRVQITVDYSATAMSGSYEVTDFLPAGLAHVANSARFGDRVGVSGWWTHAATEGQRITFYDFNGRFDRAHTYYYYARVINPGTFKAEGTLVQSLGAREFMVWGDDAVLTIR